MNSRLDVATQKRHHETVDPHGRAPWLANVVLGGQDGLVNVLGVALGVAAATDSARLVIVAGLAAAFAESISMAAVAYTSSVAQGDLYLGERAREYRHIDAVPDLEREEIRLMYSRKGFSGDLLDRIVETITSNRDVWVAVMMAEEHGLAKIDRSQSLRTAAEVGAASLIGSLIPLVPFFVVRGVAAIIGALALTALVLFAFGVHKSKLTIGRPLRGGIELALIGVISALAAYGVGAALHTTP